MISPPPPTHCPSLRLKSVPQLAPPRPQCAAYSLQTPFTGGFQKEVLTSHPGQAFTEAGPGQRGGLRGPLTGSTLRPRALLLSIGHTPLCVDWSPPTSFVLSGLAPSVGGFLSVTQLHFSYRFWCLEGNPALPPVHGKEVQGRNNFSQTCVQVPPLEWRCFTVTHSPIL